jgi:hypothetical protein
LAGVIPEAINQRRGLTPGKSNLPSIAAFVCDLDHSPEMGQRSWRNRPNCKT